MKNKFYHISTYSVMRYWTILWMAILSFSCSDFNPMDSYSRIPPDRNTDIDDGDEGDGAGGLFEKGYGTVNKPYLVMDVIQIQNMSEALVKGKMIYFQLGADIDMKSISNWDPLNPTGDYYIYFDGNNHIIKNFTCTDKAYASFFGILTDGSITRALQVGDYFCSDGKIIPGETSIIKGTYIGLVFKVGRFTADDSEYVNGNGEPMTNINGYTVALKDANNGAAIKWGNKKFALDSNRNGSSPYGYFNGFKITQLLKADGIGNYPAANACISYSPAADAKTSGWFFPAGGQMLELRNTRGELIKKTVFTNYNSGRYWQSVQNGSGDSWSVGLTNGNTTQSYISTPYYVRPIAAF